MIMSGRSRAKGSSPTRSRAHQTAWPRPSGACWRVKLAVPGMGCRSSSSVELRRLAAIGERVHQFELDVEIILDDVLVAAGDEDEVLDAGFARLVDHILDHRLVDDGQHLLRDRLGGRQKTRAETGHRDDGFSDFRVPVPRGFDDRSQVVGRRPAENGGRLGVVGDERGNRQGADRHVRPEVPT